MANKLNGVHNFVNLYNTKAHVFQINPETKASWLPKGDSALKVFIVATGASGSGRRILKIVSTNDNDDVILDSLVLPDTSFKKRSHKFGQWTEQTGMVYGLGFNSELELDNFIEALQHHQYQNFTNEPVANNQFQPQAQTDRSSGWTNPAVQQQHELTNNAADVTDWAAQSSGQEVNRHYREVLSKEGDDLSANNQYSNTLAHSGQQERNQQSFTSSQSVKENGENGNHNRENGIESRYNRSQSMSGTRPLTKPGTSSNTGPRTSPDVVNSPDSAGDGQTMEQLAFENEKLRQTLKENSKIAGVWQSELVNLRTNNLKLTQALQESKAHVEEWEKELYKLRADNKEMKLKINALEAQSDSPQDNDELQKYKKYVEEIQGELSKKETLVEELQNALDQLKLSNKSSNNNHPDDVSVDEVTIHAYQKQRFESINSNLESKIGELVHLQKEFSQLVDKLYH